MTCRVTEKDDYPFEAISGLFPVTKMPLASEKESFPAKIGDIELELACDFSKGRLLKKKRDLEKARNESVIEFNSERKNFERCQSG